jgi:uncharacterized membrane protein YcaP (DUF421 family)
MVVMTHIISYIIHQPFHSSLPLRGVYMDTKFISDMFLTGAPIIEKVLRSVIVYFFLVIGIRLAGKREMAQLNPFDFVVLLILSNSVQNAIIGNDNSVTGGIISAIVLLLINYLMARFLFTHARLENTVEGKATVLIDNGQIQYKNLKRELITLNDLDIAAHKQGFSYIQDIDHATIEPGGIITFIAKKPTTNEVHNGELVEKLDAIKKEIASLRSSMQNHDQHSC